MPSVHKNTTITTMQLTNLKQIGLTDGEIKVYEALLELGETTKTKLAKHVL